MGDSTDSESERIFGYPRQTVILEAFRISYVIGITGVTIILVSFGLYWLDLGVLEGIDPVIRGTLSVIIPTVLAFGLYVYDRQHKRDLIIADAALRVVRPIAALIRFLRGGGP
ncbi:hypothetical protein [Halostagnicola bangensis]